MILKSFKLPKGQLDLSAALITASMIAMWSPTPRTLFCAVKMMTRGRLLSMCRDPMSRLPTFMCKKEAGQGRQFSRNPPTRSRPCDLGVGIVLAD